jgi:hypothetical protein
MRRFFRKLFKKSDDDVPPHLREYYRQLERLPPDMIESFAIKPRSDTVAEASGRFGYDITNPIPVCLQQGELDYLARLRCRCGEPFMFHRQGSFGSGPDGHAVDGYELICRKRQHRITLYMDMYHAGQSSLVPENLTTGKPRGIGLPFMVEDFPDGLPQAINAAIKSRRR